MKVLKTFVLGAALVAASSLWGCNNIVAVVDGNTLTYGDHTYTIVSDIDVNTKEYKKPTASVTFSNVPSGYAAVPATLLPSSPLYAASNSA